MPTKIDFFNQESSNKNVNSLPFMKVISKQYISNQTVPDEYDKVINRPVESPSDLCAMTELAKCSVVMAG